MARSTRPDDSDTHVLRLRAGRDLAYAEQGDPSGTPVLLYHGIPGSRLTRHPDGSIAERLGVRLITFDRPGIGLSTPQRKRRILDWPSDVEEFADTVGLDRFAVLGWSGGGPYALATAHRLGDRVSALGLVASVTPLAGTAFVRELAPDLRRRAQLARMIPGLVHLIARRDARAFERDSEAALEREFAEAPACDRAILADPELRRMQIDSRREAYRQGPAGIAADAMLYLRPWGFDPGEVRTPVRLWHGEEDKTLAASMGRHFAATLHECEVTFVPGEGHMLCLTRWSEILRAFASQRTFRS